MKRFLQTILIVLVLLLVISIPFDYAFSNYLSHSKARKYDVWNDIIYGSVDANLLVLGSSRAWVQYDTHILDSMLNTNSYNLGIDGSAINRQMLRYNMYSHYQNHTPKVVLMNVDYMSTLGWTIGYEREQFFPYFHIEYAGKEMKEVEPFSLGELYLPMFRYYKQGVYSTFLESSDDKTLFKGYEGKDREWDGTQYSKIESFHFSKNGKTEQAFDEFLSQLKEQDVKVVFVYAPVYIGLTNKVDNLSDCYETFQYYSEKYQIPVLDYTYYYLSYDTAHFYNATHLNKTGAELFTTKLCHDLDSLGILQN